VLEPESREYVSVLILLNKDGCKVWSTDPEIGVYI
jgi:hypothetical protein